MLTQKRVVVAAAVAALLAISLSTTTASLGEEDGLFQLCLLQCVNSQCSATTSTPRTLSPLLRLTGWDCPQDCSYECMHKRTKLAILRDMPIEQYHGKWPFIRFLGMQEPASVLFSILNGLAHWVGLRRFARNARHSQYPYYTLLRLSGLLAVNSWIWSMVYHTRDFPWTERMDYFSAMASILFSLHVAIVRVFGLRSSRGCTRLFLMSAGYIYFLFHVMYLTLYDFDYGYNMLASIVVGAAHTLLWMAWAAANWRMRSAYAWKITVVGAAITCAMSLELLDFPPIWGVFDAHSLWHAATIPIIPHLWDFFLCDALYITPVKIPGI